MDKISWKGRDVYKWLPRKRIISLAREGDEEGVRREGNEGPKNVKVEEKTGASSACRNVKVFISL